MTLFRKLSFASLLLLAFIPLVYSNEYTFGMSVPRVLVFWTIITILVIFLLSILWERKTISIHYSKLSIAIAAYFFVLIGSSLTANSIFLSYFSNFERMDGIINFAFLILFYQIFTSIKYNPDQWSYFARLSSLVAVLVSIIAIYQHFGQPIMRSVGTLGNPLTFAFYLEVHIFLSLIYLANLYDSNETNRTLYIILTLFALGIYVSAIYFTHSRSPFISLAIGITFYFSYLFYKKKTFRKGIAISGILIVCSAVVGIKYLNSSNSFSRITDFSFNDKSSLARIDLWKISLQHFLEKPLLGYGKENFIYFFSKHYNNHLTGSGDWYDRSHNFLIDKLVETGTIGLISYSVLLGLIFWYLLKSKITTVQKAGLLGLFVSYLVFHFANFENFPSNIFLFILLIFISQNNEEEYIYKQNLNKPIISAIAVFMTISSYFLIWKTYKAFVSLNKLNATTYNLEKNENDFNDAIIGKYDLAIKNALLRTDFIKSPESQAFYKSFLDQTISQIDRLLTSYPSHPILLSQIGFLQMDNGKSEDAINTYLELKKIAPNRHINLMDLGMFYLRNNQFDAAILEFEDIYKMDSSYSPALINKAYCLSIMGKPTESNQTLDRINIKSIIQNLDKCTEIYRLNNNYLGILKRLTFSDINKNPGYTPNAFLRWLQFAVILKENDEIEKAILTYLRYFYIDYDKAEIQSLISNIQSGKLPPEAFYQKFENIWWI